MWATYVDRLPLPDFEDGICEALNIVINALDFEEKAIRYERKTLNNLRPHKSEQFITGYLYAFDWVLTFIKEKVEFTQFFRKTKNWLRKRDRGLFHSGLTNEFRIHKLYLFFLVDFNQPKGSGKIPICPHCGKNTTWLVCKCDVPRYDYTKKIYDENFKKAQKEGKRTIIFARRIHIAEETIAKSIIVEAGLRHGYELKSYTNKGVFVGNVIVEYFFERAPEKTQETKILQVTLDFSSLKDVISKGGLVMTTYKCPNCNAMVDIPETGKVLMCKHCGTPIKPVDIFEKIKSIIQSGETVTENPEQEVASKPEEQADESKPDWYKEALEQHIEQTKLQYLSI